MDDSQEKEGPSDSLPPPPKENNHVEPLTEKEQPKKQVVINDDVQVFQIIPDSTEVQLMPPPPRKGPVEVSGTLDIDKITSETMDILNMYLQRCAVMKSTARKRVYMLYRIRQSVQLYANHLEKMKNFFFHHDQIQSKWYLEFRYILSNYGDYLKVLKVAEESGLPQPVAQTAVRKVVEGVIDNVYAGGTFVSTERALCKTIDYEERNQLLDDYVDPLTQRSNLLNMIDNNLRIIRNILNDLTAQVNFLQIDRLEPIVPEFQVTPAPTKL